MKYELGQTIYYLRNNTVHSAPILARICIENLHNDWTSTTAQMLLFVPFGLAGVNYATCHGMVKEQEAFATKEELAESLLK
jgi:hypothetical protein